LLQLTSHIQQAQNHYTLRVAIMYRKRHHWVYLHGQFPIIISDGVSRLASPEDLQMVALCARILIYEQNSPPDSSKPDSASSSVTRLSQLQGRGKQSGIEGLKERNGKGQVHPRCI
jgi:hypothetical protein